MPAVELRKTEKLLSVSTAAAYLGISTKTLRRWDKKGKVRAFRTVGNQRRFLQRDLERIKRGNGDDGTDLVEKPLVKSKDFSLFGFFGRGLAYAFFSLGLMVGLGCLAFNHGLLDEFLAPRLISPLPEPPKKEELVLGDREQPIMAASSLETAGVNLLRNVSFEVGGAETKTGQNQFGQPKLWDYSSMGHQDNIYVSDESIRSGTLALKVEDRAASAPMPLGFSQPSVTTRNGASYNLSVFVRTKDIVGQPKLRIGFKGTASTADPHYGSANWAGYSADKYQDFSLLTIRPTVWTQFSFTYENAALGKYPFFEIIDYQGGKVFFDDVQLTEGKSLLLAHQEGMALGDGTILADTWANLYPYVDNQGSIGSSTKRFTNVYAYDLDLENNLSVGGVTSSLSPDVDDTHDLGTTENRWKNLYLEGTAHLGAVFLDGSSMTLTDDDWIGLGSSAGRIVFDDQATDEIEIRNANLIVSGSIDLDFTEGSVIFIDSSGALAQDNANFFWDDSNNRLGIGTTGPGDILHLVGDDDKGIRVETTGVNSDSFVELRNDAQRWKFQLKGSSGDRLEITDVTNGQSPFVVYDNAGNNVLVMRDGSVGIGTVTPGTAGLAVMNGNVGIGMTTPSSLLHLASTSTSTSFTGFELDWSPSSSTTLTGDLFNINIGSSGNAASVLNITDASSTLFKVEETQVTSAVPHQFTAAGDVLIAYDIVFTNQTASYIKSYGPMSLEAGESWESNDLTLKTYNAGDVVFDLSGTGGFNLIGTDTSIVLDTTTTTDTDFWLGVQDDASGDDDDKFMIGDGTTPGTNPFLTIDTAGNVGIGTTEPGYKLDVNGSTGIAGALYLTGSNDLITNNVNPILYRSTSGGGSYPFIEAGNLAIQPRTSLGRDIVFLTGSTSPSVRMVINRDGNVGVGTTSPGANMHIWSSNAGVVEDLADALLILEKGSNPTLQFQGATSTNARIAFGDSGSPAIGMIEYSLGSDELKFYTNGSPQVTVDSSGNVGIGTTVPSNKLSVAGGVGIGTTSPSSVYHTTGVAPDGGLIVEGNVGIGTTDPGIELDVVGSARFSAVGSGGLANDLGITADGTLTTDTSDITMKTNLVDLEGSLEKITQLQGYYFNWVGQPEGERKIGMIAQEVAQIIPEVTFTNQTDGKMGINYSKLTTLLAEGIKEQQLQIEELKLKVAETGDLVLAESIDEPLVVEETPVTDSDSAETIDWGGLENELASMGERVDFLESLILFPGEAVDLADGVEASDSAELAFEDLIFEPEENLELNQDLALYGDLNVLGETVVADLGITGTLATGLLTIDGLTAEINSLAEPLKFQSLALGNIEMMGGKVEIDTEGNIKVMRVTAEKYHVDLTDSENASAGQIIIPEGEIAVEVETTALTEDSLIFVTPEEPAVVGANRLRETVFEVTLKKPLLEPLKVSWWVIN